MRFIRLDNEPPKTAVDDGFVQADASRLPFTDGAFDAVIANRSLEHIAELELALAEIGRVTRVGGALSYMSPCQMRQL